MLYILIKNRNLLVVVDENGFESKQDAILPLKYLRPTTTDKESGCNQRNRKQSYNYNPSEFELIPGIMAVQTSGSVAFIVVYFEFVAISLRYIQTR